MSEVSRVIYVNRKLPSSTTCKNGKTAALSVSLGEHANTWNVLKETTGMASDLDLLVRLMTFYVEAEGIDLTQKHAAASTGLVPKLSQQHPAAPAGPDTKLSQQCPAASAGQDAKPSQQQPAASVRLRTKLTRQHPVASAVPKLTQQHPPVCVRPGNNTTQQHPTVAAKPNSKPGQQHLTDPLKSKAQQHLVPSAKPCTDMAQQSPVASAEAEDPPFVENDSHEETSALSSYIIIHQAPGDEDDETEENEDVNMTAESFDSMPKELNRSSVWTSGDETEDATDTPFTLHHKNVAKARQPQTELQSRPSPAQSWLTRRLDGMLWREAVLRGRPMPPDDVSLMFGGPDEEGVKPLLVPAGDPRPMQQHPHEAVTMLKMGCSLCPRQSFSSRSDVISHFWLRHPETRERFPTQVVCTKQLYEHAHCTLCFTTGSVMSHLSAALVGHVDGQHVACRRASGQAPHVCEVCLAEFGAAEEHDRHVAAAHAAHVPREYSCCQCKAPVKGAQSYIRHLRVHYTEYKYGCSSCPNFRTRDPDTMLAHTEKHDRRYLRCCVCGFRTRTYRTVADHLRKHLKLPRYVCPTCGYQGFSSSRYFNHLDSHGGRLHRCNLCPAEFTSLVKKAHHKIKVHRQPAELTCDQCGLVLDSRHKLRRHQLLHLGVKPFRCEYCDKRLASRQSLRNHVRVCPEADALDAAAAGRAT